MAMIPTDKEDVKVKSKLSQSTRCQSLQFLYWPLEAGSKSESIPSDSLQIGLAYLVFPL